MGFLPSTLPPIILGNYISLGWQITWHSVCEEENPFHLFLDFTPSAEEAICTLYKSLPDRRVGCIKTCPCHEEPAFCKALSAKFGP